MRVLLLCSLAFPLVSTAGELRWTPEKPQRGSSISVEYTPDSGRFAPGEYLWLYVYEFRDGEAYPFLREVPLEYQHSTKKHIAAFRLDTATVFALCKVGTEQLFDTRQGRLWEILVYEQEEPLHGALLQAALTRFGTLQEGGWRRAPNLWEAERLLQQAVRRLPESFAARVWLLAVQGRLGRISAQSQEQRLRELLQQPYSETSPADVRAALWALGRLRERRRMELLEERVLQRFPQWELSREILAVRLNRAAIVQEYRATAQRFLRMYPPEEPGYEEMYLALVRAFLQHDHPDSAAAVTRQFPRAPAAAYAEIANYWLEQNRPEEAEQWVRQMRQAFSQQRLVRLHRKPQYVSSAEWERGNRLLEGMALATEARLLRQQKRIEEAIQRFQEALSVYREDAPVALYEQLVDAFRILGQHKNAFAICTQAILSSRDSDTLWSQFRELFLQLVRRDSLELQDQMFRLQEQAAARRRQLLWSERLEWSVPAPIATAPLVSLQGDTLTLAQLRGKTVLLDFWATWCRPCKESLPYLQKLWELYRDRTDVHIIAVNVWEPSPDRPAKVRNFLQDGAYDGLPVYIDPTDAIPVGLGVTAVPTQVLIDRNGLVQFRTVGYTNPAAYFRSLQDMLEAALQQR